MKKSLCWRILFYFLGLLILVVGLILNTKSNLGVSPILSIAYCITLISGISFGNMTLVLYCIFVVAEMILHVLHGRGQDRHSLLVQLGKDLLQLPLSIVFTRFMNLFSSWIPSPTGLPGRFLVLIAGITLTGIGAAMSLNMRIIPNPGDGIVQAIADSIHKPVGFTKNCVDVCCIIFTICLSLLWVHKLVGIGAGTAIAVVGVGRVIALFNHLFLKKMSGLAGLSGAKA